MDVKLSMIMPCYNSENYISVAVESFLAQENPETELIIVDDGSSDGTGSVSRRYLEEHENIRYIYTENGGAGRARNIGLEQARGEMVGFLDSDDALIIKSLCPAVVDNLLQRIRSGTDIVCTPWIGTDMEISSAPKIRFPEKPEEIRNHMPKLAFWTCIYSRNYLKERQIRFYEYRQQDIETAFRYRAFSNTENIAVCPELRFYLQRNRLDSNTHTWNLYHLCRVKAAVYSDLLETTKWKDDRDFLKREVLKNIYSFYKLCLLHGAADAEELREVHDLYGSVKKNPFDRYILRIAVLNLLRAVFFKRKYQMSEGRKEPEEYDNDTILKNLRSLSQTVGDPVNWREYGKTEDVAYKPGNTGQ